MRGRRSRAGGDARITNRRDAGITNRRGGGITNRRDAGITNRRDAGITNRRDAGITNRRDACSTGEGAGRAEAGALGVAAAQVAFHDRALGSVPRHVAERAGGHARPAPDAAGFVEPDGARRFVARQRLDRAHLDAGGLVALQAQDWCAAARRGLPAEHADARLRGTGAPRVDEGAGHLAVAAPVAAIRDHAQHDSHLVSNWQKAASRLPCPEQRQGVRLPPARPPSRLATPRGASAPAARACRRRTAAGPVRPHRARGPTPPARR